jgi:hypothetical protein
MTRNELYRSALDHVSKPFELKRKVWAYWVHNPDGSQTLGPTGNFYHVAYQRKLQLVNHCRDLLGLGPLADVDSTADWQTQVPKL